MAIGSTAHKLILDSTQFVAGATLSRKELAFLKQTLQETATSTDLLAAGQTKLEELFRKGALTSEQYARAMDKLQQEVGGGAGGGADTAVDSFDSLLGRITPVIDILDFGRMAFDAVGNSVRAVTDRVGESIQEIDDLITTADTLGIPADAFQNLATAADYADVSVGTVASSVEKMLVAISKGEDGAKKFADVFRMMGLDAESLVSAAPDEAFAKILTAIQGIGNQADRVRAATAIFGSPDVLRMSADAIADAEARLERMGGHIGSTDYEAFNRFDQTMKELGDDTESLWRRFTLELTPALEVAAGSARDFVEAFSGDSGGGLAGIGGVLTAMAIGVREFGEAVGSMPTPPDWFTNLLREMTVPGAGTVTGPMGAVGEELRRAKERADELDKLLSERRGRGKGEFDFGPGEEGVKTSPFKPFGTPDAMYDEDRKMADIVDKYKKRRIELELTGPYLEIYRAKLDGLKGAELEAFKAAVDKHEMEKRKMELLDEELRVKREISRVDIEAVRIGSREDALLAARARAGAFDGRKRLTSPFVRGARTDGMADFTAEGPSTTDFLRSAGGGAIIMASRDTETLKEIARNTRQVNIAVTEVTL